MSSNEVEEGGSYESSELASTLVISLLFMVLLYSLYEMNRHMRRLYLQRRSKKLIQKNLVPPTPPRYIFGWLVSIYNISDEELLRMCGLDSYMLLQYAKTCFKFAFFTSFIGVIIFVPVYATASDSNRVSMWNTYTLSNVPKNPSAYQLWAPALIMYIYAFYFCHLLNNLYKDFVMKRLKYLQDGDPNTPQQTYYSVIVEGIPPSLRSAPKLKAFFEDLLPNQVHSAYLALDLTELEKTVQERRIVRDKLERAVAVWKATGFRPLCSISANDAEVMKVTYPAHLPLRTRSWLPFMASSNDIWGHHKFDAIDQLCLELEQLNSAVAELQSSYYRQTDELNFRESEMSQDAYGKIELGIKRLKKNIFGGGNGSSENRSKNGDLLFESPTVQESLLQNDGLQPMSAAHLVDDIPNPLIINSDISISENDNTRTLASTAHNIKHSVKNAAKGVFRSAINIERNIELLTVGAYYNTASTGFVTLTTRVAQAMVHQMLLSHDHVTMSASPAPNPNDIIWKNVPVPEKQLSIRKDIAGVGLAIGAMFWSILVGFISSISNLQSIQADYPPLASYTQTHWYQFVNSYLTSVLLLICIAVLPLIFDFIARSYEGLKLESDVQNSIMKRYFYYQLANVFVSVGLGSISGSLQEIIESPRSIFIILGENIPGFSIYFTNLLIVKAFSAVPIELLRTWPLILHTSLRCCLNEKRCSWRDLRSGVFAPPTLVYGWIYPSLLMVLMIITTYSTIAPLLMPFGMLYFALVYCMYKYQILFVYVNSYQSGGYMFYAVFRRSMVALLMSTFTLIAYMAIRRSFVSGPFYVLIPLPLCIIRFWTVCEGKYKKHSKVISLEVASKLDEKIMRESSANEVNIPSNNFTSTLFFSGSLVRGDLKPAPYRRKTLLSNEQTAPTDSILDDEPISLSLDRNTSISGSVYVSQTENFEADDPEGCVELDELFSDTYKATRSKGGERSTSVSI